MTEKLGFRPECEKCHKLLKVRVDWQYAPDGEFNVYCLGCAPNA